MKKLVIMATLLAFAAPVFAGDKHDSDKGPKHFNGPRQEMGVKDPAKAEAFKAMAKKHKATEEKLEKLVKEYKKAKDGSKKQVAAKEEITKVLGEVRDEQIAQRAKGLEEFEKRLADMKARLAEEQKPEAKSAWLEKTTEQVIAADGKLDQVFGKPAKMGGPKEMKGSHKGFFGKHRAAKGGHEDHILPMPPAPQEEE